MCSLQHTQKQQTKRAPHFSSNPRESLGQSWSGPLPLQWCRISNTCGLSNQIKCIYIALLTSADISKCCTETQHKTPFSKQCRCRSTVARKNCLERHKPRKKPREEPDWWPVLFWLCRVEIITEHGQDVQMVINDQHGQIIIITVVVEGAASQHRRSKCQLAFHSRSLRVSLGVSLPLLLSLGSWKLLSGTGSTSGEEVRAS